jgi:hypothetical protein
MIPYYKKSSSKTVSSRSTSRIELNVYEKPNMAVWQSMDHASLCMKDSSAGRKPEGCSVIWLAIELMQSSGDEQDAPLSTMHSADSVITHPPYDSSVSCEQRTPRDSCHRFKEIEPLVPALLACEFAGVV